MRARARAPPRGARVHVLSTPAAGWGVPLRGTVPGAPPGIALDVFLRVIRAAQDGLAQRERLDTKLVITRLRKVFYDSRGWDELLIPGAAEVRAIELPAMAAGVRELQDVRMPDGELVDVGHVLAGLDAINHPVPVAALGAYEIAANADAVTWAGDLGSVLGEVLFAQRRLDRSLTDAEVQVQVDRCAPPHDMLGNADAYAIAAAHDISPDAGRPVADILLDYYRAPATAGTPRSRRFTTFALAVGIGPLEGAAFAAEQTWLRRRQDEIASAAALYVGATGDLADWGRPAAARAKLALMRTAYDAPLCRPLLERFVGSLRAEVAREASAAATASDAG